jgi:hypothetical protein
MAVLVHASKAQMHCVELPHQLLCIHREGRAVRLTSAVSELIVNKVVRGAKRRCARSCGAPYTARTVRHPR